MLAIAIFARGGADFGFPQWKGIEVFFASSPSGKKILIEILHLNHVLIVIIAGMLIRNTIGIPNWAAAGVKTSRLFIKTGIILLGSLYSIMDLAKLGATAVTLLLSFVFITALFTLWLGKRLGMHPASASVLAAGTAVCGVTAIVATAPAVKARTTDVAYSIATILSFGVICLFVFPTVGTLVGLSPHQFGAWAGTGILNSGQVLAASLAFDPGTVEHPSVSLKTGEIFNLTRVIFLPFVVLILALLYSRTVQAQNEIDDVNTGLWSKFPVFVLGFLLMVFLTSFGFFGSTSPPSEEIKLIRNLYSWFFAIGLTGLGMQISFGEMRKAGGTPLIVGVAAALLKAIGALIVVLLFIPEQP
ncbi:MAG: putative sulfate exporter family transporter [Firmicutes bacterium]|nr:putative sulfate exporter family transporter [Bacillota bacterium]